MDRSDVIYLLDTVKNQNKYGVWVETQISREVFCQVDSVTRAEFFEGGRNGLNPEYRITMFFGDYNGERDVVYNGKAYSVYRTYKGRKDEIELYVQRKGGSNGKESQNDGQEDNG